MGGDMRVQGKPVGGLGALDKLEVIDAESVDVGDFTAKRTVEGHDVFLTEAGAEEFDRLVADDFEMKVVDTPHGLSKLWDTDVLGPKGLLFPGDPKAKR
jgi:hypothetical protein